MSTPWFCSSAEDKPMPDFRQAPAAELIAHMAQHTNDRNLVSDLDCIVPVCYPEELDELMAYVNARKNGPYFSPGSSSNNHSEIVLTQV